MRKIICFIVLASMLIIPTHASLAVTDSCQPVKNVFKTGIKVKDGVCQMHLMRKEPQVMMMGHALSPEMMELALTANFQSFGSKAEVIGEFALLGEEVNPVIDALRKGGIEISALHNHMIGEVPQIYYVHFEGMGNMDKLAKAVKDAVNKVSYQ